MADPKLEFEISGNLTVDAIYMPEGIKIGDASSGQINQSINSIAIGNNAGNSNQEGQSIAIGENAGNKNQKTRSIAVGLGAGRNDQSNNSIAIGSFAGNKEQSKEAIAIGYEAGKDNQKEGAVGLGYNAGEENQGLKAIAIGFGAGRNDQSNNSIAIGNNAGKEKLGDKSIAIGYEAEIDNSSANITQNVIVLNATNNSLNSDVSSAFFVKPLRDVSSVSTPVGTSRNDFKVMVYDASRGEIAYDANGQGIPAPPPNSVQFNDGGSFGGNEDFTFKSGTNQLDLTNGVITMPSGIRIGDISTGQISQAINSIAIGNNAGKDNQKEKSIAIGLGAGFNDQSNNSIAIGSFAGNKQQSKEAIAIGYNAGKDNQKEGAVGLGYNAGEENQGLKAIAIGFGAGRIDQSNNSIAIGNNAGKEKLGDKSIAIGYEAEIDNSSANVTQNVIVLNASNNSLNSDVSSAFFVKPLRDVSDNVAPATNRNEFKVMVYDPSRGEVAYDASYNGTGGGGTPAPPPNSVQFNNGGSFGGDGDFTFTPGLTNQLDLSNSVITMPAGIRIGDTSTGQTSQAINSIAIGNNAGNSNQGFASIAIGEEAGDISQGNTAVAIGPGAGYSNQSNDTIAIGTDAGKEYLGEKSIAIGWQAEYDNRIIPTQNVIVLNATDSSLNSDVSSAFFVKPLRDLKNNGSRGNFRVMIYDETRGEIGFDSSYNGTGSGGGTTFPGAPANSVQFNSGGSFNGNADFTFTPGITNQLDLTNGVITMLSGIRIGDANSGKTSQNNSAIAIGKGAGSQNQQIYGVAIGFQAGEYTQGSYGVAIGNVAGFGYQKEKAIAIGKGAGFEYQKEKAIAIGAEAGGQNQGSYGVAIGLEAGTFNQSDYSIAIGYKAGNQNLGEKSIVIGYEAEFDNSNANVAQNIIILNASDSSLNSDVSSAFFVKPLRDVSSVSTPVGRTRNDYKIMVYDSLSGEIAYDASYNGTSNIDLTNVNAVSVSAETITVSESLFLGSITYEDASLNTSSSSSPTQITLNTPVILFDISDNSNNYYTDISNQGQSGQTLDIFMETNGGTVRVDFGTNTLVTGGGLFRYLTFNSTGQSASLIYVGSKWRIRNCGALPSVS